MTGVRFEYLKAEGPLVVVSREMKAGLQPFSCWVQHKEKILTSIVTRAQAAGKWFLTRPNNWRFTAAQLVVFEHRKSAAKKIAAVPLLKWWFAHDMRNTHYLLRQSTVRTVVGICKKKQFAAKGAAQSGRPTRDYITKASLRQLHSKQGAQVSLQKPPDSILFYTRI